MKRDDRKAAKPAQDWINGTYEEASCVLKVGDNYFGGFAGLAGPDGKSMVKLKNGLTEAKLIWGQAKVRDYIRRLRNRGYEAKAYRVIVDREIQV